MKHYGAVTVKGLESLKCYKVAVSAKLPSGWRIVGNGTHYLYVTRDESKPRKLSATEHIKARAYLTATYQKGEGFWRAVMVREARGDDGRKYSDRTNLVTTGATYMDTIKEALPIFEDWIASLPKHFQNITRDNPEQVSWEVNPV